MSTLDKYKKLQVRFNLPQLSELKSTFKFDLDSEEEIFDQIRIEMSERLFTFTERILEPIVSGAESYSSLLEQDMMTREERMEIFQMYKKVQALKWENNLLMITPNEKETAKWIKKVWNFWNEELGEMLTNICKKMSDGWKQMSIKEERTVYHG
jgi:hypothetical protein